MKAIWTKNNRRTKKIERQKPKQINNEKKIRTQKNLRSHQICSFRRVVGGEGLTNEEKVVVVVDEKVKK